MQFRNTFLAVAFGATSVAFAGTIEPDLQQALKTQKGSIKVFAYLREQHSAKAAAILAPVYQGRIDDAVATLRDRAVAMRNLPSLSRKDEARFESTRPALFEAVALKPLTSNLDRLRGEFADAVTDMARSSSRLDFIRTRGKVESLGGTVEDETLVVSAIIAVVPANRVKELASWPEIASVGMEHETQRELDVSAQAMLATSFWSGGATGGPADVGVLDTGVQRNHAAFTSFRWEASSLTDGDGHGTHVCGIMCSADATFRGMAWGADTVSVYATSSESTSMVGLNWLMTNVTERAEDVNHSFGYGQANGTDYRNTDQFFDGACDNFSFLVSKSNGNNGYGTTTLTHPAPAYNLIAVASMNDFGTATRNDDRVSSFSSSGPTLAGRKKPDLAAPGEGITSTYRTGGFTSLSGTSMAAPHAGGSVVLLMGLGCPSPMAAKAVLINNADAMNSNNTASTADDSFVSGSRWDKAYGWGYINLSKAYLHAPDVFERTLPAPPNGGRSFKLFKGQMFTNDKASVTWNRHLVYNGASYPTIVRQLSNLDLLAYNAATNAQTGASTSAIDNVEQLSVGADAMTVVKVQSQGNFDPNVPTERFALATEENFVEASGPITSATWFKLPGSTYTAPFNLTVTVTNTGDLPVFNAQGLLENYIVVSGQNPAPIGTLLPGQSIQLNWVVRRGITTGITYAKTTVTGVGFGENWSWVLQDPNPL